MKKVIGGIARKEKGFHVWHCRCDCGNEVDVRHSNLQNGWTRSGKLKLDTMIQSIYKEISSMDVQATASSGQEVCQ